MNKNKNVLLSTIIGKETKIIGSLKVKGGIRIEGEVDGKIESDGFVTVGQFGVVKSDIIANECLISGTVEGNVVVKEALELDKNAHLFGNIITKILKIHSGAVFSGNCKMNEAQNHTKENNNLIKDVQKNTEVQ
jgi:cytoskeletal protein CcmA (bactofilin family)